VPTSNRTVSALSLSVAQVAALLGCANAHVYDLCEQGKLPHWRDTCHTIRFDCCAVGSVFRSKAW